MKVEELSRYGEPLRGAQQKPLQRDRLESAFTGLKARFDQPGYSYSFLFNHLTKLVQMIKFSQSTKLSRLIKQKEQGVMAYGSSITTKLKIIHAAGELAAERGFDSVSTRMVADRSGQNIGSIHYHFGGKDGLFEAVVQAAMHGCAESLEEEFVNGLDENSPPEDLSRVIRVLIESQISDMFRSDRPAWHVPVIYQLLQREDHLYDFFDETVVQPSVEAMTRFFRIIDPNMSAEEIHLRAVLMKMPIFAHGDYMKAMLRMLKTDHYSESYLQLMEDLIVKQTQLLLGLPLDK